MAEWFEGRLICGARRKGGHCKNAPIEGRPRCKYHGGLAGRPRKDGSSVKSRYEQEKEANGGVAPTKKNSGDMTGRYQTVIPKGLKLHYNEEDPEVLSLRHRAALLDAILKKTMASMDDQGTTVNCKRIRENCYAIMHEVPSNPQVKQRLTNIIDECNRATDQEALETKLRYVVKDITEVVKAETSRLVAIGGALTLQQIGGLVNGIMTEALKFMSTNGFHGNYESDADRAKAFISIIRNNVIDIPNIQNSELDQAADVILTPRMGGTAITRSNRG